MPEARDADIFLVNRRQLQTERETLQSGKARVENEHRKGSRIPSNQSRITTRCKTRSPRCAERRSNLDSDVVAIRERLCVELSFDPDDLPFAGELLQVRDDERDWEGAAERATRFWPRC